MATLRQKSLLPKVKANLILQHDEDDELILSYIAAAMDYGERYQHLQCGYYNSHCIPPSSQQAIIILASHMYESRDGSTGGFFADNVNAAGQVWVTVNRLLALNKNIEV